jgi:hypothetical protein
MQLQLSFNHFDDKGKLEFPVQQLCTPEAPIRLERRKKGIRGQAPDPQQKP